MTEITTTQHCTAYPTPTRRTRRRRKITETCPRDARDSGIGHWRPALSALSVLLALSYDQSCTHVSAFAPSTSTTPEAPTNRRTSISFRNVDDDDSSSSGSTTSSILRGAGSDTLTSTSRSQMTNTASHLESLFSRSTSSAPTITTHFHNVESPASPQHDRMPSWLRPPGHLAEEAIVALRGIMKESSYLSRLEVEKVIAAVREASNGDEDQMTGAAEFCHMLVETMEMAASVETLIAAAYHYCECYTARSHEAQDVHSSPSSNSMHWECYKSYSGHMIDNDQSPNGYLNSRAIKIGQDAHQLVHAAARIKRAEMMASQTVNLRHTPEEASGMIKMLLSETLDWRALAIRSAACLYRLRGINKFYERGSSSSFSKISPKDIRVAREALSIHAPLASRLGMHRLKNEMEGAAFSILYPRQHAKVTNMTQQNKLCNDIDDECVVANLKDGMRLILNRVTQRVENLLETDRYFSEFVDSDSVKVTARIKEPYSLWRKMLKLKAKNILEVPDALALRVVFNAKKLTEDEHDDVTSARERALCHHVQKSCVNIFKPVKERNGRFKDYIARPKPNGYQSLHYTAFTTFDGEEWPFEIQVRSGEMHQVAEYGLAAHWDYKAQDKTDTEPESPHYAFKLDNSSDAYLRSVQEWHWQQAQARASWVNESCSEGSACANENLAPYLEKLMRDQSNLAREHVFVFLSCNDSSSASSSSSQILELPAGACVLDAIRKSERSFGYNSRHFLDDEIVHNGSPTSVTQQLSNGDIVTIPLATANASTMSP